MRRRKFLFGIGALSAGGAAAMSTGAFTSVNAERDLTVAVAGDASAFLALDATNATNGAYASETGDDGELQIDIGDLSDSARDRTVDTGGSVVNKNAITFIRDLFRVRNQGTQAITVSINAINNGDLVAKSPYNNGLGKEFDKAWIWFNAGGDGSDEVETNRYGSNEATLEVGEQVQVEMAIQIEGSNYDTFGDIELVAEKYENQ